MLSRNHDVHVSDLYRQGFDPVLGAADREAGDTMMLCVSRSLDDHLLLDL
jgi:putative NADPH-quinone reductase